MSKLAIPHDGFVFVGDGRKSLFLRNEGDEKFPNLVTARVLVDENPPTHEQGTDRPGLPSRAPTQSATALWRRRIGMKSRSIVLLNWCLPLWRASCESALRRHWFCVEPADEFSARSRENVDYTNALPTGAEEAEFILPQRQDKSIRHSWLF